MTLREVIAALRASWWLAVVGLVTGIVASFAYSVTQTPLYVAYTQLFVSTTDARSTSDAFEGSLFSRERAASYAALLTGERLAGRVVERLDLSLEPEVLAAQIVATPVAETVLLDVTVTDPSPERARDIARAVGTEFAGMVSELETPAGGTASPVKVTVVNAPDLPVVPSSPSTRLNVALGGLVGMLMGAGISVLRARLDRSLKDADEAGRLAGAPVIGLIVRDEGLEKRHAIERGSTSRSAEGYRQLRTNLQFLNVDQPPKVIMVSSALPSEGKTTAVVNLALALADAGRRVTIVEADLRRPKVTRYLGMVGGAGLTNILTGSAELDEVIQRYGDRELSVIAAGPTPPNPGELLASSQMLALVEKLRPQSDYVLVDAPPILPVADSSGLAVHMDGVLLSVRYGSTTREQVQQAAAALQRVGATTLGVIMNIVPQKAQLAHAYGYEYSYHTESTGKRHRS